MIKLCKHVIKQFMSPKYRYLRKFNVKSGDIVIDLGANVGEVADYFLRKGAVVHAYEPNPHAFVVLKERVGCNPKATLYQNAVSNYNGKASLWLHKNHAESEVEFSQGSSLQPDKSNVSKDHVDAIVINIADLLAPHPTIKILKIDIEGGEYDIIDTVLAQAGKIDHILLETHGQKHQSFAEKEALLQEKIARSPFKDKIYTDWF